MQFSQDDIIEEFERLRKKQIMLKIQDIATTLVGLLAIMITGFMRLWIVMFIVAIVCAIVLILILVVRFRSWRCPACQLDYFSGGISVSPFFVPKPFYCPRCKIQLR